MEIFVFIVYFVGAITGVKVIAQKPIKGSALKDHIKNKRPNHDTTIKVTLKILAAMNSIHKHDIVHKDLKTGN